MKFIETPFGRILPVPTDYDVRVDPRDPRQARRRHIVRTAK
jgi:hypothetical protein